MRQSGNFWQQFDYILFGASLALMIFGILVIRSATLDAVDPDLISRVPDQINFAIFSIIAVFITAAIDYRMLGGLHVPLYIITVVLLLMVVFFGVEGDAGARRWLRLGIQIQPSEIGKLLIIITLGHHLAERYHEMHKISTIFKSFLHVLIPVAFIFTQPDLGTSIVYIVIWGTLVWSAGLRLHHITIFLLIFIIALPFAFTRLEPYQQSRITVFLFPASDDDATFNIDQALISIGSGGVFGKGYATGSQNRGRFLRVRHTDFIFSVIAEEFGMVGSITIMGLIGIVLMRILRGARLASDPLGSMICYGVAAIIFFQTVVSIGMNLNLLPVTGLTLPFVSSGGTSLLIIMIGIGLVESVIIRKRPID